MSDIRFLHAADLHLDTPFKGVTHLPKNHFAALRDSTFQAFSNFIQYALETKPDFIVIVGDIYDGAHRSLRAQLKFQEGMQALADVQIPVFLSYGNHDHLQGTWTRFDLPENVHVFTKEVEQKTVTIRGENVHIYGFSYPARHVSVPMIDKYPVAETDGVHIGLLHGSIEGDDSHAVYAPFTKDALLAKRYQYWALGHIHKRQSLHENPPIVYSGNLQGRHRNEQGMKGFYEVLLANGQATRHFIGTSTIIFEQVQVSCVGIYHAGDWLAVCEEALNHFQESYPIAAIVELKMVDIDEKTAELFRQSTQEEWLEVLREVMQKSTPFIWVNHIYYDDSLDKSDRLQLVMDPIIKTMEQWTTERWEDVLQDLYQHTRSIQYLDRLTPDDFKEIQAAAARNLLTGLMERE